MSSDELVSIVMPVKNALPYLEECLKSILNQSYKNWELIAVNDHSTDKSLELLHQFSLKDNRVKVHNNKGVGIIPALQLAYANSSGAYITRMDADDIMPTYKLDIMLTELQKHNKNTLVTGYVEYFSENGVQDGFLKYQNWLNSLVDNESHHQEIYKECVIPSPCWLTTRQAFEKVGGFNSKIYPEDYDLTFRFHLHGVMIKPIPKLLHLWRDHSARTSRNHEHYSVNSFLELKVDYFLQLSHDPSKQLVIWGAGKKGKRVAELLQENNVNFDWICNNPNKIGVTYKDTTWQNCATYFLEDKHYQVIGTVSKPTDQDLIKNQINRLKNAEDFWFC